MSIGREKDTFPKIDNFLPRPNYFKVSRKNIDISAISLASIVFQPLKSASTKSPVQEKSYPANSMNIGQEKDKFPKIGNFLPRSNYPKLNPRSFGKIFISRPFLELA